MSVVVARADIRAAIRLTFFLNPAPQRDKSTSHLDLFPG